MNEKNIIDYAYERGFTSNAKRREHFFLSKHNVSISTLKIDTDYQRKNISNAIIKRIANNFDFSLFNPVTVSKKSMCILDGQHRVIAAYMAGFLSVPVNFVDVSKEDEPTYFVLLNKRENPVSSIDKFNASVEAGDDSACDIKKFLDEIGIKLSSSGCRYVGQIKFINVIQSMYKTYGRDIAFDALDVQKRICEFGVSEPMNHCFYTGIAYALANGIKMDEDNINKIISIGGQAGYIKSYKAEQIKNCNVDGGTRYQNIHMLVMNKIIKKRKSK